MNKLKAIKHPTFAPLRHLTMKSIHVMTLSLLWLTSLLPLNNDWQTELEQGIPPEMLVVPHKEAIATTRGMKRNWSRVFIWDGLIFIWSLDPKMLDAWFGFTRI
jgi:hypothetical protein